VHVPPLWGLSCAYAIYACSFEGLVTQYILHCVPNGRESAPQSCSNCGERARALGCSQTAACWTHVLPASITGCHGAAAAGSALAWAFPCHVGLRPMRGTRHDCQDDGRSLRAHARQPAYYELPRDVACPSQATTARTVSRVDACGVATCYAWQSNGVPGHGQGSSCGSCAAGTGRTDRRVMRWPLWLGRCAACTNWHKGFCADAGEG
jgi:hypothetical protein